MNKKEGHIMQILVNRSSNINNKNIAAKVQYSIILVLKFTVRYKIVAQCTTMLTNFKEVVAIGLLKLVLYVLI